MTTNAETLSLDDLPGDFGSAFPEPRCWGSNSYEHYKGECRHFEEDDAEDDDGDSWELAVREERERFGENDA